MSRYLTHTVLAVCFAALLQPSNSAAQSVRAESVRTGFADDPQYNGSAAEGTSKAPQISSRDEQLAGHARYAWRSSVGGATIVEFGTRPPPAPVDGAASSPGGLPISGRLSSQYGLRVHPIMGGMRWHNGVDLAAPAGTPIRATSAGVVSRADWTGGYGLLVELDNGAGLQTLYGHMSRIAVSAGQKVQMGDVLGYVGSTGLSTGPHVHYEVRRDGRSVDPLRR